MQPPATVHTRGHNLKFILPHCSKDVFKHFFPPGTLRAWNALPQAAVEAVTLDQFKASLPRTNAAPTCFYPAPCDSVFVNCTFFCTSLNCFEDQAETLKYTRMPREGCFLQHLARISISVSFDLFIDCCQTTELKIIFYSQSILTSKTNPKNSFTNL